MCQSHFLNKVSDQACSVIKKESLAEVFSCEFCKIYRNTFRNTSERLFLFLSKNMTCFYFSNLCSCLEILPKIRSVWQLEREEKWVDNWQYVGESSSQWFSTSLEIRISGLNFDEIHICFFPFQSLVNALILSF